jgi:ubiquinone/menaquinone biosynthesis C-methylase UbiE
MNRKLTNAIRYVMDEMLPPIIRDSKVFMYPFYILAYRGSDIKSVMNFKKNIYQFSDDDYKRFYESLRSISRRRLTDLNDKCIQKILDRLNPDGINLIDVGCGKGYLLHRIQEQYPNLSLTGLDIVSFDTKGKYQFVKGTVEQLPFPDKSFDIVVCCHTIEHLLQPEICIHELMRICRKQLIIVTPCQRYYFYTLDEHVNFFPSKESLTRLLPIEKFECEKLDGDWYYEAPFTD